MNASETGTPATVGTVSPSDVQVQDPGGVAAEGASAWGSSLVHLAIIVPLALALFLFQLGRADWEDDMESVGGQIVWEMVNGHGWVLPLRNDRHIPVKPPLFYWLGALSALARHSGVDLLDPRLPSAVLGTLVAVLVYFYTRRLAGASVALWAAVILITTPQFVIESRNSRVDIALCLFLTAALLLAQNVWAGEAGRFAAITAGVCLGLATLSKGPLALALFVLVFAASAVLTRPGPRWRELMKPATVVMAIGLPALWYAAATLQHGWAFLHLQIYSENVARLIGEQGHFPIWWYAEPLLTGGLPWMLALPAAAAATSEIPQRSRRFLWVWVVTMFVFFSLAPGKRKAYLLLLRPALAILLAGWLVPQLTRWRQAPRVAPVPRTVHGIIGAVVIGGVVCSWLLSRGVGGFGSDDSEWSYWWRWYLHDQPGVVCLFALGLGVGIELIARWVRQRRFTWAAYAFAGTVAWGLAIGISAGAIVRGEGATFRPFARRLALQVRPDDRLALLDVDDDSVIALLFHLRRHVPVENAVDAEHPCTPPHAGLYLVAESQWEARSCFQDGRWRLLERGGPTAQTQRRRRLVLAQYDG